MTTLRSVAYMVVVALLVQLATSDRLARALPPLLASFSASPQAWSASFETNPANGDNVSQADDHMRQIKEEVRNRVETEMDFGELGNVTTDTGRLLEGGARAFVQATAPTVDGSITASCLAEADWDGNRGCDEGRIFCDTDTDQCYFAEDTGADGDADVWTAMTASVGAITASRAVVSDGSGAITAATTTSTEIGYVNGVTSAIQTQINLRSIQLAEYTPSSTASVDITSVITASYDWYEIHFDLIPVTDDVALWVRTDSNNGASFDAGASNYAFITQTGRPGDTSSANDSASVAQMTLTRQGGSGAAVGNAANEHIVGMIRINSKGSGSLYPMLTWNGGYFDASTRNHYFVGSGSRQAAAAIDAVQLLFSSGNISSGTVRVFGIAN